MHCSLMTDWITIRGQGGGGATTFQIPQSPDAWVDACIQQDLVFWVDVRAFTLGGGTLSLNFETAPTRDESAFSPIVSVSITSATVSIAKVLKDSASLPVARWVRWRLASVNSTSVWDATFRVFLAANSPGAN